MANCFIFIIVMCISWLICLLLLVLLFYLLDMFISNKRVIFIKKINWTNNGETWSNKLWFLQGLMCQQWFASHGNWLPGETSKIHALLHVFKIKVTKFCLIDVFVRNGLYHYMCNIILRVIYRNSTRHFCGNYLK